MTMTTANSMDIESRISFKPIPSEHRTLITYSYTTLTMKDGGGYVAYIPGFDIIYFADTEEEANVTGDAMMETFFDFWTKNEGQRAFMLELNRMGFRSQRHDYDMANLLKSKTVGKANFKLNRSSIPPEFASAQKFNRESNFAVAS